MNTLIWYRNDLRVYDHEALFKAAKTGPVLFLYCFDPRLFSTTDFGFSKTGRIRTGFLIQTVQNLREKLRSLGAELIVRKGEPEVILPEIVEEYEISKIFVQKEIASEEIHVEEEVRKNLGDDLLEFWWGSTLFHKDDIPFTFDEIPNVFSHFRKACEKRSRVRQTFPVPQKIDSPKIKTPGKIPTIKELGLEEQPTDQRAVMQFKGGEDAALKRLQTYFWEADCLKKYKYTRNQLLGANYSSKFSPWLANGSVSPVMVYEEVKKYEDIRTKNVSTYWVIFELIWRDFFRFSAAKHGDSLFHPGGIQNKEKSWSRDRQLFSRWAEGKTGIPFIDANMRELNLTGYMSNRGRQNVASFLSQNLNIDWRMGAEYFESKLIDYDPYSNYGNWAYNSTVGHDPRNRYFNIINQARKYDKKGEYVRHWMDELKDLPAEFIHQPHTMTPDQQKLFNVNIGEDYPEPVIDLEKSYKEIRQRN